MLNHLVGFCLCLIAAASLVKESDMAESSVSV